MEREIVVKGQGQARSLPDRAVVEVLVEADGATREQAYGEAARLAQGVDDVLANRDSAIARVLTAALVVHPRRRWKRGESVRTGWRAARRTVVEITDFSQLGDLIAEVAAAGGSVCGPTWRLDESNAAHRHARVAAAQDARRRAEDYAAALRVSLGPVAWICEPGLRGSGEQAGPFAGAVAAAAGAGRAQEPDEVIDVTPAEIETGAAVEVGFSLQPDDARPEDRALPRT
jgi:uncharacterized protein